MKSLYLSILLCFFGLTGIKAQLAETLHQVIKIDSLEDLSIQLWNLDDTYKWEVKAWPARNIMVETKVTMTNGSEPILKFFIENERYALKIEREGLKGILSNKPEQRRIIKTAKGEASDIIQIIIYLPEDFKEVNTGVFSKKVKENNSRE
ncbi:MAG: hypothetical protein AAFO07_19350 [Bacteroidota bacterium]